MREEWVEVKIKGRIETINVNEIRYIEKDGNETYVYMVDSNDEFSIYQTMDKWLEALNPDQFVSPHRSYIINLAYMKSVSKDRKRIEMNHKKSDDEIVKLAKDKIKQIAQTKSEYDKKEAQRLREEFKRLNRLDSGADVMKHIVLLHNLLNSKQYEKMKEYMEELLSLGIEKK
ncbi:MAG: LytTR family transcriptional regulator [Turicibacter sp.]|nr:LytTR family transcriptional regulator [Turicibacter sp.]